MDRISLLGCVVELAHSSLDVDEKLRLIFQLMAEELSFDIATYYSIDAKGQVLHPDHSNLGKKFVAKSGSFTVGQGIVGVCAQRMAPIWIGAGDQRDASAKQWREDFKSYKTLVAVPVADDRSLMGVVLLLNGALKSRSSGGLKILSLLGREIAGVLRDARLQQALHGRLRELTALSEVSRAASGNLELEPLLGTIVETAAKAMCANAGVIRVLDEQGQVYQVSSVYGKDPYPKQVLELGSDSDCEVVRTSQPFLFSNAQSEPLCRIPPQYGLPTCLCVPLKEGDRILGILSVYGKVSTSHGADEGFEEGDIKLLQTMAGYISNALSRAIHHQKIERLVVEKEAMVRELSILHASGEAMMKTVNMNRLLRVILMAITLGDGLGFNRAMLFLANEDKNVLEGKIGIGPGSPEEAASIWESVGRESRSFSEWLNWALEQTNWIGEENTVHRLAKRIRIPLDEERCILVRAYKEKKAIRRGLSEPLYGLEKMRPLELGEQFACAPVMARGEPLGVILVDNVYSARPISDGELHFLTALASHAGLSIQNAMLYESLRKANEEIQAVQERLIHSERLATLGEFSASMAHEIRNPLVSIGGYARLLQKKHQDAYSQIIYEEVERLEAILNRMLVFSRTAPLEREDIDLNFLLEEIVRTLREEIRLKHVKVEKEFSRSLPEVSCDKGQIKQVFMNLIQNALEAMEGQGTLMIRTRVTSDEGGLWIVGEVSDTGKGIPADVIQNIFNPFFTTKEKGTGLGLAIIQRFVDAHKGRLEVDNRPGQGTTFRVQLPSFL